jgi:hypothetical protein
MPEVNGRNRVKRISRQQSRMVEVSAYQELIEILEEARFLLALPDNDFAWSSWEDGAAALSEVDILLEELKRGLLPQKHTLSVLFAPTGPIQEVSLSSGWGKSFLELAERFDTALAKCT